MSTATTYYRDAHKTYIDAKTAPTNDRARYAAPTMSRPSVNPSGMDRMVDFDVESAMKRNGVTIHSLAETCGVSEWEVRKWRIAGRCPMGVKVELVPPPYWVVTIRGNEYRAYPHHDRETGRKIWKLWRPDTRATYKVAEVPGGITCNCPDAEHRHHGNCKHVDALLELEMVVDAPY